jgi:hypothetical protein
MESSENIGDFPVQERSQLRPERVCHPAIDNRAGLLENEPGTAQWSLELVASPHQKALVYMGYCYIWGRIQNATHFSELREIANLNTDD